MNNSDVSSSVDQNSVHPDDDMVVEDMTKPAHEKDELRQERYPLMPPDVHRYVRNLMQKEKEKDRIDNNRDQWVMVGKIIDRFLFYLSFVFMFLVAVIMFPVLAGEG